MTARQWVGFFLAIFVLGNMVLGYATYSYQQRINALEQKVASDRTRIIQLITDYNDVVANYKKQKNTISFLQSTIALNKSELNNYRDRLSKADYFVSRAKCGVMVDELKAYAATSNADIKPAILTALKTVYSGTVTSSSFTTYWDNHKSAMLTTIWGDSGSTKTIVAWTYNSSAIQTIYDVNNGCVMYTGDR